MLAESSTSLPLRLILYPAVALTCLDAGVAATSCEEVPRARECTSRSDKAVVALPCNGGLPLLVDGRRGFNDGLEP